MEEKWNLNSLYKGFETPEYQLDLADLENLRLAMTHEYKLYFDKNTGKLPSTATALTQALTAVMKATENFLFLYSKLHGYAMFRSDSDVSDDIATTELTSLKQKYGSTNLCNSLLCYYLRENESLFSACLTDSSLEEYVPYLNKLAAKSDHLLASNQEELLAAMRKNASGAWSRIQSRSLSKATAEVCVDNEVVRIPLAKLGSLSEADTIAERLDRFKAELKSLKEIEDISGAALCAIKGEAIEEATFRRFSSVLDMSLNTYGLKEEALYSLVDSVSKYLPSLCKYYEKKAEVFKIDGGLPYCMRETPIVKSRRYEWFEAKEMVLNSFAGFSGNMYRFAKNCFEEGWIDYEATDNKASGACCDGVYAIKESRIRLHYNKTLVDVNNLAHELGHGYHNLNLFGKGILNYDYDMPITETAAKFSEIIFKQALTKMLPGDEALAIEDFMVSSLVNTIVDIQSRFYFEQDFFNARINREPTGMEISLMMENAQKRAYGKSLNSKYLHPYMWINKPHYYFVNRNYYNFPYSFGALLSVAMYEKFKEEPKAFIKKYDVFLANTGKINCNDLCKILDIDLCDSDFWCNALKSIENMVNNLIAKL